eukprot:1772307-Rhodomonas_salina.2
MNHQGAMVNSLGSGHPLLSRQTNFPGMGFNTVNICYVCDQPAIAIINDAPGKSPLPCAPMMVANDVPVVLSAVWVDSRADFGETCV